MKSTRTASTLHVQNEGWHGKYGLWVPVEVKGPLRKRYLTANKNDPTYAEVERRLARIPASKRHEYVAVSVCREYKEWVTHVQRRVFLLRRDRFASWDALLQALLRVDDRAIVDQQRWNRAGRSVVGEEAAAVARPFALWLGNQDHYFEHLDDPEVAWYPIRGRLHCELAESLPESREEPFVRPSFDELGEAYVRFSVAEAQHQGLSLSETMASVEQARVSIAALAAQVAAAGKRCGEAEGELSWLEANKPLMRENHILAGRKEKFCHMQDFLRSSVSAAASALHAARLAYGALPFKRRDGHDDFYFFDQVRVHGFLSHVRVARPDELERIHKMIFRRWLRPRLLKFPLKEGELFAWEGDVKVPVLGQEKDEETR